MPLTRFSAPHALTLAVAAILLLAGSLAVDLIGSRKKAIDDAARQIDQHDRILAEHVARSLDSIEVLLDEMRLTIEEGSGWKEWSPTDGHRHLKSRLTRSLPQIRDLLIFDNRGILRHASFADTAPAINVQDRAYFRQLAEGAERARFGPFIGRTSKRPSYALARRINNSGGRFDAALVAILEPRYFESFCRSTRIYNEFEAAIVNADGLVVASCRTVPAQNEGDAESIGKDFRETLANGEFSATSLAMNRTLAEGKTHLLATEPVPGYPDLRVVSATPQASLLETWRQHAQQVMLISAIAFFALAMAGLLIRRQIRRLAQLTTELKASQETLEDRIKLATRELEARRNDAERLADAKSRFFAAASHDLRQPLHALQLFLGDFARVAENPEQRALVQRIESATRAMAGQLRSMLDISRLDMANIVPERKTLQLTEMFEQLAATYAPAAEAVQVRLLFRPRAVTLETDGALLIRLLGNLIDNAIKFSAKGTVLVCARWRANAVRIEVRDNGQGISPAHQKAIYEEFFQIGNEARDPDAGLGLGLAIAHRIARLLGTNIILRSAVGRGSSFALTLPSLAGAHPGLPSASARLPRVILIGTPGDLPERVARWGYTVARVDNITQAWRLLDKERGIPVIIHPQDCAPTSALQSLLRQHPGIVITTAECDMPDLGAYHLQEPLKPARLRALLRSLH